ncbi:MAG: hypothetical protein PHX43_05580 [Alphaproteobacteria bacterium]|nr:hypothetical protein [Alphaproteobacteria bacterium]
MVDAIEEYSERVSGTNIDPRSLLCTDYFNHFNEVIMLLNMLPDMPEMLDEIDKWDFRTYREHFSKSGLGFSKLAIECFEAAPVNLRERLEKLTVQMSMLVVETRVRLRQLLESGEMDKFKDMAILHSMQLQGMVDDGGAVIHGYDASLDQSGIDKLF